MASSYTYDHNTAHILEPIQGYDLVSFMNFWAPLDESVQDAVPGTVMHRNTSGKLVRGLTKTSMAQFLYSKQDTEDVINNPITINGLDITSVSMNSYGDFPAESGQPGYVQPFDRLGWQDGVCSNMGTVTFDESGNAEPVVFREPQSVYTTFPGACGLELGSSEFALYKADGTTRVDYAFDQPLTSPAKSGSAEVDAETQSVYGTSTQQAIGGFLCPGDYYKNNICGVVSRLPVQNENGTWIITFWACHKPALDLAALGVATSASVPTKLSDLSDVTVTPASTTTGMVLKATVTGSGETATVAWAPDTDAT